ncbi:sodium-independent sulfate anion transporter-like isoform X2 [Venturia canescens]|nr:sodium-independent sulfate anion transporter-like isoform X2 [Venturia canescens]
MALVTISYTRDMPIDFVILLTFVTGLVQLIMGLLHLGFLVDFISMPVTSGFTSATSMIIIVSQLRGLFGLSYKSGNVVDTIIKLFKHIGDIRMADTVLGFVCIVFLLFFRKLKDFDCSRFKGNSGDHKIGLILEKTLWFLSIGRNALVVFTASLIAFHLQNDVGSTPFLTAGKVLSGLPNLSLPAFSAQVGNQTYTFVDMAHHLGFGMIVVPLVGVLTNVAIAKAFVHDAPVEASQEMLTLGLCNLAGCLISSMPTCGAFTRSAVSSASGIQTPLAGLYSGTLALLALSFLTPYFGFIPKASLAAVLICAVIFLVDFNIIKFLWSGSKRDAFTAIITFLVCIIFDVEIGLFTGTLLNALFLLYLSARPKVEILHRKTILGDKYLLVKPEIGLFYPAIDYLSTKITKVASEFAIPVVVDFERLQGIDYTAVKGIERLLITFEGKEQKIFFINVSSNVKLTIQKLSNNRKNFMSIDSEASLIDILESQLTKCPTAPMIAVSDEKGKEFEKKHETIELKGLDPLEHESLLLDKDKDSENVKNTST